MTRTRSITKALGTLGLLLALGATAPACVVTARGSLRTSGVVAYQEPPPPQEETYEARAGHVWIKGRWDWQNGGWQWVPGHWERERAGYGYQDGRWEQRNGQWHWIDGQWVVVQQGTVVTGGGGGTWVDDRPQVRDHRDGQPGTVVVTGGGGQGPLVATNGAGTVVAGAGGVVIVGPNTAPPPIRVENPGAARSGYIWVQGNWQWTNGQYEWVPGHWERQKAGYQWYDGRWEAQGSSWVWIAGEWRQVQVQTTPTIQVRDRRTH